MSTILVVALIAQSGGWSYSGFIDDPQTQAVDRWSYASDGTVRQPFERQKLPVQFLEPVAPPPTPPPPIKPPAVEEKPPKADPGPPPTTWELPDVDGQVWTHRDPDFLRKWVRERNQQLRPPLIRTQLPPLETQRVNVCLPGMPCSNF